MLMINCALSKQGVFLHCRMISCCYGQGCAASRHRQLFYLLMCT